MVVQLIPTKGHFEPSDLLSMAALFIIITVGATTVGCLEGTDTGSLDVVVVSILPQKEMVKAIAGYDIKVVVMIPQGQSPHSYSPTPGQLKDVSKADIYFKVGSGVEFEENHLSTITESNPKMVVVDCSKDIDVRSFDEHHGASSNDHHEDEEEEGAEEDDHDHDHEGTDPHIWLSPSNMRTMAGTVRDALVNVDPDNSDLYTSNYNTYVAQLDTVITDLGTLLSPHKDKEYMVYHPAWGYFGDEFELVQIAIESEGTKPGPQGIAVIIEQAKEHNITVIFVEPQFDSSAASTIASEIGGRVVKVNPLAEDYMENMKRVAAEMAAGFK